MWSYDGSVVDFTTTYGGEEGYEVVDMSAVYGSGVMADPHGMARPLNNTDRNNQLPARNIRALRLRKKWSMRELGDRCQPPVDHTTIYRLETGLGYTSDSLERVSKALGVTIPDLFIPMELQGLLMLSPSRRAMAVSLIRDLAAAEKMAEQDLPAVAEQPADYGKPK